MDIRRYPALGSVIAKRSSPSVARRLNGTGGNSMDIDALPGERSEKAGQYATMTVL
jgi:hypothetical protein